MKLILFHPRFETLYDVTERGVCTERLPVGISERLGRVDELPKVLGVLVVGERKFEVAALDGVNE